MPIKHLLTFALLASGSSLVLGQQPTNKSAKAVAAEDASAGDVDPATVPEKALSFSPSDTKQKIPLSPVTSMPLCDSDGSLLIDLLNHKDLSKHSLIAIAGDKSQTYLPSAISDLRDVTIRGFYSSGSTVVFLVRATRQNQESQAASKSPAGYDWSSYHEYLAKFKRDGSFDGSLGLDTSDDISRAALFSSGGILALGYDRLNSALHLLLFDSSGKVIKILELPAGRRPVDGGGAFGSAEAMVSSASLAGAVVFTPYKDSVLVWRRNSNDPILEVQPGGATREVPLQVPKDFTFVEMVPAADWWVANFRRRDAIENAPYGPGTYTYFEIQPQDANLSAKLSISKDTPAYLACEADGHYLTFNVDKDNNMQLYRSK